MSVQIGSRSRCNTQAARQSSQQALIPWAIVMLMAAYIAGSHLFGGGSPTGEIASLDRPAESLAGPMVRLGDTARRTGGQIAVYGQVRNESPRALADVQATVELYDAGDHLVGLANSVTTDRHIAPGATTTFEAYADDRDDVTGYRVRFGRLGGGGLGR